MVNYLLDYCQLTAVLHSPVDNVGYGDVGGSFQGGAIRGMPTPRIDKLQSEGLVLTQFITEPGCTPSRAGLITGRYAHRSGCGSIIVPGSPNTLGEEEITMAELFKSAGYNTAITGKWHLGGAEQSQPTNQGFDQWRVGVEGSSDQASYRGGMQRAGFPEAVIAKAVPQIWEGTAENGLKAVREYTIEYRHQIEADLTKASIDIINDLSKEKEPFFLYVGFTNSHYPIRTAPEFTGKSPAGPYGDAMMPLWNWIIEPEKFWMLLKLQVLKTIPLWFGFQMMALLHLMDLWRLGVALTVSLKATLAMEMKALCVLQA